MMLHADNGEVVISAEEELEYISQRYSTLTKMQIDNILKAYYDLVESGESPNPEDYFSSIADICAISVNYVEDVFDIQFKFLVSKGIAV
jgi:hypothetical protein